MRKTVEVDRIRQLVNKANELGHLTNEQMQCQNTLLEIILHETGNYRGFRYIAKNGATNPYDVNQRCYYSNDDS